MSSSWVPCEVRSGQELVCWVGQTHTYAPHAHLSLMTSRSYSTVDRSEGMYTSYTYGLAYGIHYLWILVYCNRLCWHVFPNKLRRYIQETCSNDRLSFKIQNQKYYDSNMRVPKDITWQPLKTTFTTSTTCLAYNTASCQVTPLLGQYIHLPQPYISEGLLSHLFPCGIGAPPCDKTRWHDVINSSLAAKKIIIFTTHSNHAYFKASCQNWKKTCRATQKIHIKKIFTFQPLSFCWFQFYNTKL